MNRLQLFQEMYEMASHNLLCYSQNYLMTKPKLEYVEEWKNEKEKIDLLSEMIKEEKQKEQKNNFNKDLQFKSFMDLNKMKELGKLELGTKLVSLEDRKNGFSILVEVGEGTKEGKDYLLYFLVHDKKDFDNSYRDIWCASFDLDKYKSFDTLNKRLEKYLKQMKIYLEEECEGFEGY